MNLSYLVLALLACAILPASALHNMAIVSVYQGTCAEGDFTANLETCRAAIQKARDRGSHFVSFPECFLSGYESPLAIQKGARPLDDPDLRAFIAESAAHEVVVLAGLARRVGTNLHNSVLVIHRGRLLGVYNKVLLTDNDREALGFTPGTELPVFEAHGVRFGVLVGEDTSQLHLGMAAKLQGAEILFTAHHAAVEPAQLEVHLHRVRNSHIALACQLQVVVARANVVQVEAPARLLSYGDSAILSPQGVAVSEAGLFRTELRTALITPTMLESAHAGVGFHEVPGWLRTSVAELLISYRPSPNPETLRAWLESMAIDHQYTRDEMASATGLGRGELESALAKWGLEDPAPRPLIPGHPPRVLPYPGGRHPRLGFFDGARNPQRETKVSVFAPWAGGGYAVVDVPEAIFSNLGLIYLAHTHIPTVWDQQGIALPRLEWNRSPDGTLTHARTLPNGIAFGTEVRSQSDGVRFLLWLTNGTPNPLSGLRVQNCVMLGHATGFAAQTLTNKVFGSPFAAARSADGTRWVLTAWEACGRAWGNEWVPCIHADPVFPDCAPGQTVRLAGWLSFYEGPDVQTEIERLTRLGYPKP
jgi:predicted amidohydrolase